MTDPNNNVTRSEFDSHRKQVSRDIENLAESIRGLGDKIDRQGKPDWRGQSLGFAVFAFVLGALWAVYDNGLERTHEVQIALDQSRFDRQIDASHELNRRVTIVEKQTFEHDRDVRGINSGQSERLNALERERK